MGIEDRLDETELVPLRDARDVMYQVYGHAVDLDIYNNEHYGNPYRLDKPFSIAYLDGEPAAVSAFIGMRMVLDGREMNVSQAVDGAVIEKARGKGLFSKVYREYEERDEECEFIIGLPNENSYPRLLHYGFTKVVWLVHYMYITAPFGFVLGENALAKALDGLCKKCLWMKRCKPYPREKLKFYEVGCYRDFVGTGSRGKVLGSNSSENKDLVENETEHIAIDRNENKIYGLSGYGSESNGNDRLLVPVTDDEIAQLYGSSYCHFIHNADIYRWKYSYNPDTKFYWSVLRTEDGRIRGYALCHLRPKAKGNMVIVDDYYADGDAEEKQRIYRLLFSKFADLGGILEVPFVNPECGDDIPLKQLHFFNACKKPFGLRGGPLILSKDCKYFDEMKKCEFRNIDSDVL
jgi:hypothetical protein